MLVFWLNAWKSGRDLFEGVMSAFFERWLLLELRER